MTEEERERERGGGMGRECVEYPQKGPKPLTTNATRFPDIHTNNGIILAHVWRCSDLSTFVKQREKERKREIEFDGFPKFW